jgi:hypothetical protein
MAPSSSSMNLVALPGTFAVCRYPANARLPAWILDCHAEFFCVTRTADELSIVCLESRVVEPEPLFVPDGADSNQKDRTNAQVERPWATLKVQGPLDFGLTGILSALAAPLAAAGISIFALSTYDTDYLMVKADKLQDAAAVLRAAGNNVTLAVQGIETPPLSPPQQQQQRQPRDGPATMFETDPLVARLVKTDINANDDSTFGLVVVAAWPPSSTLQDSYKLFRAAALQCFEATDTQEGEAPAVYLYPPAALHVTLASFHSIQQPPSDISEQVLTEQWKQVLEAAVLLPGWPVQPLQLVIDRAQIGSRAGILLWKETTGGLQAIRTCIPVAVDQLHDQLQDAGIDSTTLAIPSIVHSTFLRFYQQPLTSGTAIQERFQERVQRQLTTFFPSPITVATAKLVCERRPYMHIPADAHHVFASITFEAKGEE